MRRLLESCKGTLCRSVAQHGTTQACTVLCDECDSEVCCYPHGHGSPAWHICRPCLDSGSESDQQLEYMTSRPRLIHLPMGADAQPSLWARWTTCCWCRTVLFCHPCHYVNCNDYVCTRCGHYDASALIWDCPHCYEPERAAWSSNVVLRYIVRNLNARRIVANGYAT